MSHEDDYTVVYGAIIIDHVSALLLTVSIGLLFNMIRVRTVMTPGSPSSW